MKCFLQCSPRAIYLISFAVAIDRAGLGVMKMALLRRVCRQNVVALHALMVMPPSLQITRKTIVHTRRIAGTREHLFIYLT
jgi:hypothetical protein